MTVDGQITLDEFIKPHKINIVGICDDGYCPNCNNSVDLKPEYIDLEQCPHCGYGLDWSNWHIANDDWYKEVMYDRRRKSQNIK